MPKNKGFGGKKKRRGKNMSEKTYDTILRDGDDQFYAKVVKILGNERFDLIVYYIETTKCEDGSIKEEINPKQKLGIMRGKMRKRMWVNTSDIVLVSTRDYEESKVDILHKYKLDEVSKLKKYLGQDVNIGVYESQIVFDEEEHNDIINLPPINSDSDGEELIKDI
jgi:translation initiation factor 1A